MMMMLMREGSVLVYKLLSDCHVFVYEVRMKLG